MGGYCYVAVWRAHAPGLRLMERRSADHEAARNRLFQAQQAFHGRGKTPDNLAAGIAAQAAQYALLGYPVAMEYWSCLCAALEDAGSDERHHQEGDDQPERIKQPERLGQRPDHRRRGKVRHIAD